MLTKNIPISYPTKIIQTLNKNIIYFTKKLNTHKLQNSNIFSNILTSILNKYTYNKQQIQNIIKYIIKNKIYKLNYNLHQLIKKIPFIKTNTNKQKTIKKLFNPKNKLLQNLISNPSQFPSSNIQQKKIKIFKNLKLKSQKYITTTNIYNTTKIIHKNNNKNNTSNKIKTKQITLFTILKKKKKLLQQTIPILNNTYLKSTLNNLKIIQPLQTPTSLIPNLS